MKRVRWFWFIPMTLGVAAVAGIFIANFQDEPLGPAALRLDAEVSQLREANRRQSAILPVEQFSQIYIIPLDPDAVKKSRRIHEILTKDKTWFDEKGAKELRELLRVHKERLQQLRQRNANRNKITLPPADFQRLQMIFQKRNFLPTPVLSLLVAVEKVAGKMDLGNFYLNTIRENTALSPIQKIRLLGDFIQFHKGVMQGHETLILHLVSANLVSIASRDIWNVNVVEAKSNPRALSELITPELLSTVSLSHNFVDEAYRSSLLAEYLVFQSLAQPKNLFGKGLDHDPFTIDQSYGERWFILNKMKVKVLLQLYKPNETVSRYAAAMSMTAPSGCPFLADCWNSTKSLTYPIGGLFNREIFINPVGKFLSSVFAPRSRGSLLKLQIHAAHVNAIGEKLRSLRERKLDPGAETEEKLADEFNQISQDLVEKWRVQEIKFMPSVENAG